MNHIKTILDYLNTVALNGSDALRASLPTALTALRELQAQQATSAEGALASSSEKTWCQYVAGMIGTYLNEPVESSKVNAIAGIIERRLWALPVPKAAVDWADWNARGMLTKLKCWHRLTEEESDELAALLQSQPAQQAQKPVEDGRVYETIIQWEEGGGKRSRRELARRIEAIYAAPKAQKPVGYFEKNSFGIWWNVSPANQDVRGVIPLYTAPSRAMVQQARDALTFDGWTPADPEHNKRVRFSIAACDKWLEANP